RHSIGSDHSTLHEHEIQLPITPITPSPPKEAKSLAAKAVLLVQWVVMVVERSLVIYGWGQVLSEGSIFWWYGVLTFARYLGAWSRWGWGWNALSTSKSKPWSAALVESLVIFTYGFTQQFMERFGKNPGDPYTAKDIEHISIAVMFWGGGLVGMAVESPMVRGWIFGEEEPAPKEEDSGLSSPKGRMSPHTRKGSDIHHHPHHQHHPSNTTLPPTPSRPWSLGSLASP
ncbi:9863_t:CDS:2, partial [Acaulospora colombiana]